MAVRDCWAYDDGNIDVESTLKLQLTSTDGCSKYSIMKERKSIIHLLTIALLDPGSLN